MLNNFVLINEVEIYSYPDFYNNYSPSEKYPEYLFNEISPVKNDVYEAVRNSFFLMGYDKDNYGTSLWNPLGNLIKPDNTVLIKPNLVRHANGIIKNGTDCLITHASIIRAVVDYALIALKGSGKIIIGDAPIQSCDFDILLAKEQGLYKLIEFYKSTNIMTTIELCDFRDYKSEFTGGVLGVLKEKESGHKNGVNIDLGKDSCFSNLSKKRYKNLRVADYHHKIMFKYHNTDKNEYIVTKKMLEADVIINMPKPKTHKLAGVTIAMKNFVGFVTRKECLPHYSVGSAQECGDEYEKKNMLKRIYTKMSDIRNINMRKRKYIFLTKIMIFLEKSLRKIILISAKDKSLNGMWHGNDTIWRTILDLNKIVYFADKNGILCDEPQRKVLNIGDMIVSGHGEGPIYATPINVGTIVVGEDILCFDEAVCTYMGFDYNNIPTIKKARELSGKYIFYHADKNIIKSNNPELNGKNVSEITSSVTKHFTPCSEWKKHLLKS